TTLARDQCMVRSPAHRRITGATTNAPPMSPSHQVSQMGPKPDQRAAPPSARLVTPNVALIAVLTAPASRTKRNVSIAPSNAARPLGKRRTRYAPASPSSVLPAATPRHVATEPDVVMFATNAPTVTAGQAPYPSRSSPAIAIPVGGHTAVALACTIASSSPSFAVTK